jgi:hypothetical protein
MMRRYLPLLPLLLAPAMACAYEMDNHVDLVCDAAQNVALVRFAVSAAAVPVFPRLPKALDHGLSARSGSGRTDCTLANGTTIRVRGGVEQAFAYGAGGGNPPAFFSLWINRRKVFSRKTWMPGYEKSSDNLRVYDGAVIAANRITICATAEGKPQRCTGQLLDLAKAPLDRVEYGAGKPSLPAGQFSVIAKGAANQQFCAAYLGAIKPGLDEALYGQATTRDLPLPPLLQQTNADAPNLLAGPVALQPGVARKMVIWSDETHYFDGTVIALAPSTTLTATITAAYSFDAIEKWPVRPAPPDVTLISGGQKQLYPGVSPRYVHLVPQQVDGALYVFAYPTNKQVRPTAALVKPLPEGGFITLCAFNRTEPNF